VVLALDRKRGIECIGLVITVELQVPTAGSNMARRHMSTTGNRDSTGRAEARVAVA
jgi:hypothetical protein